MSTKEKMLDAALTLFAENGYSDMFSVDICGCSGRTFHKDRKGD